MANIILMILGLIVMTVLITLTSVFYYGFHKIIDKFLHEFFSIIYDAFAPIDGVKLKFKDEEAVVSSIINENIGDVRDTFMKYPKWSIDEKTKCILNGYEMAESMLYDVPLLRGDILEFIP